MAADHRALVVAIALSLLAALFWAAYYIFVLLVTPGTAPSAVFALPFLFGGASYALWAVAIGEGRAFLAIWKQPAAWVRVGLLLSIYLSVLASTYVAGPVDTSLLSLIGDVVLTPIIVAIGIAAYRARMRTPLLWIGMGLCLAGGGLAIVGSQRLTGLHGAGYLLVLVIPFSVALYFLLTAQENERSPPGAVVAQSVLGAALFAVPIALVLPGGYVGLTAVGPLPLLVLVALGVTTFFVAEAMYFAAIRSVGLVVPPMLMTAIPVFAALLGWAVLGIQIPLLGRIGIPIAVAGALLALRAQSGPPPIPDPASSSR